MPVTVLLQDVIDALDMQFDEQSSYLDLDTGRVETVSDHLLGEAEEPGDEEPDRTEWEEEDWELAKKIMASDRFVELPTKFDVHEWQIMADFSNTVKSDKFATIYRTPCPAPEHSGTSSTTSSGTASKRPGMPSARTHCGRSQSTGVKKIRLLGSSNIKASRLARPRTCAANTATVVVPP